jgi:predicted SnoaL-like aldol condensation-catalyzing enzyme
MLPKEIVRNFYESDLANDVDVIENYLHEDCQLHWNSSKGFTVLDKEAIKNLFIDIHKSYESVRMKISHLLQDGNFVTTRYTLFTKTIEDPENEVALAHFITIWEVKDAKLYRGHEISQLADVSLESLKSFSEIKV